MTTQNSIDSPLVLPVERGGTGAPTQAASFDSLAPTTTKGDLPAHNGTGNARLGVGADGTILIADSGQALGVKWGPAPASGVTSIGNDDGGLTVTGTANSKINFSATAFNILSPATTKGDLIVRSATGNTRLGAGTDGQILQASSTAQYGLVWADAPSGGGMINQVLGTSGEINVTSDPVAPVASLATTGVSAGTYNNCTLTVDAKGRITSASTGSGNATINYTGTPGQITVNSNLIGLDVSGVTAGTYQNVTITVDATGRITAATGFPQGVLPIANGGTALSTSVPNSLLYVNSAGTAFVELPPATVDNSLLIGYTTSAPTWTNGPLMPPNGGLGTTSLSTNGFLITGPGSATVTTTTTIPIMAPDLGFLMVSGTSTSGGATITLPSWTNGADGKLGSATFNGVICAGPANNAGFTNIGTGTTAGHVLTSNGVSATPSFKAPFTSAVKADQIAASSNALPVVPAVQQFHPSAAKAWVRFTVSGGIVNSSTGFNVNTISRTGAGVFQINFITPFTTASIAVQVSAMSSDPTNAAIQPICSVRTLAVGSVIINSVSSSSPAYIDAAEYYVCCFGTQ